jgi:hypothetical protein
VALNIDELERAVRSLREAERGEFLARFKSRKSQKTLAEKLLNGVDGHHLEIELICLTYILKMRKWKELRKRGWSSQKKLISARFREDLHNYESGLKEIKCDVEKRLEEQRETSCAGIPMWIRDLVQKGREEPDAEIECLFSEAFRQIEEVFKRLDIVFQFMDEVLRSERQPRKPEAWANRYIGWRTKHSLSTVKQYLTTMRKQSRQSAV